jgi:5-methylcytosine-specific restriction endonuclease McrA
MVYTVKRTRRDYPLWNPPEREFVEPNSSDSFIHWLFRYRCIDCKQPGTEVNEIIPRSRSKKAILDWRNRVLLCRTCHELYHKDGVTDAKIKRMQEIRLEFLKSFDRLEYVV